MVALIGRKMDQTPARERLRLAEAGGCSLRFARQYERSVRRPVNLADEATVSWMVGWSTQRSPATCVNMVGVPSAARFTGLFREAVPGPAWMPGGNREPDPPNQPRFTGLLAVGACLIPGGQVHVFGRRVSARSSLSAEKWTRPRPVNAYGRCYRLRLRLRAQGRVMAASTRDSGQNKRLGAARQLPTGFVNQPRGASPRSFADEPRASARRLMSDFGNLLLNSALRVKQTSGRVRAAACSVFEPGWCTGHEQGKRQQPPQPPRIMPVFPVSRNPTPPVPRRRSSRSPWIDTSTSWPASCPPATNSTGT